MPSGNDPPPAYPIFNVELPGRTLSHVTQTTVTLSFHPDDGDDAERIVEAVRTAATGRTVSFEVR